MGDNWLLTQTAGFYYPQNVEDLRKFYDHFMKDVSNGWGFTPKVRLSIFNPGGKDMVNRPEADFPLQRQVSRKLYLDAGTSSLVLEKPVTEVSKIAFDATTGVAEFTHTFDKRTELTGYFSLKLWVESIENDDIDLFVKFFKKDSDGTLLETRCVDVMYLQDDPDAEGAKALEMHRSGNKHVDVFFAEGATGRLQLSHRELDKEKSTPHQPAYPHAREQKLKAGEIVPVEIELWPHGMIWEAGQKITLSVAGHNLRPEIIWMTPPVKTLNKGEIVIHTGGQFDSHLLVPFIPD
jgi:predicted acyl esterase